MLYVRKAVTTRIHRECVTSSSGTGLLLRGTIIPEKRLGEETTYSNGVARGEYAGSLSLQYSVSSEFHSSANRHENVTRIIIVLISRMFGFA